MPAPASFRSPSWLAPLLACPACSEPVHEAVGEWSCDRCGVVGQTRLGFPDFLGAASSLAMAGGATMDLIADQKRGEELQQVAGDCDFARLARIAASQASSANDHTALSPRRRRVLDRFHRHIADINADASSRGGEALLTKVDTRLSQLGWRPLASGVVLEAGGGHGYFMRAFSARYQKVVFVDASLANVVLAAKAAEDEGLDNIAFVRADVRALPFGTGVFDLVHQNGVIEHVDDPSRMVGEAKRVKADLGYYVCVSPNRMAVTPEPHFGLPGYGFIPLTIRSHLIPLVRGFSLEDAATEPRSLRQLRAYLALAMGGPIDIFFLPRGLPFTARQTPVRRAVRWMLTNDRAAPVVDHLLNVTLLPVVPQHIAIAGDGQ